MFKRAFLCVCTCALAIVPFTAFANETAANPQPQANEVAWHGHGGGWGGHGGGWGGHWGGGWGGGYGYYRPYYYNNYYPYNYYSPYYYYGY
jgi:Spy/CpxP family protein refolding chaperone